MNEKIYRLFVFLSLKCSNLNEQAKAKNCKTHLEAFRERHAYFLCMYLYICAQNKKEYWMMRHRNEKEK